MAKKTQIELLLAKVCGIKESSFDDRQAYLKALVEGVPDDKWDDLTDPAQAWINEGQEAVNKSQPIAEFSTDPSDDEATPDEQPADDDRKDDDMKSTKRPGGEKAAAAKKPAAAGKGRNAKPETKAKAKPTPKAEAKAAAPKSKASAKTNGAPPSRASRKTNFKPAGGVMTSIKELLIKNMDLPVDDILDKLKSKGLKPSRVTTATIRSDFRHSVRVLQQNDKIKGIAFGD